MARDRWAGWPMRESLTRVGIPRARTVLDGVLMVSLSSWAGYSAYASEAFDGPRAVLPLLGFLGCAAAVLGYRATTLDNRLLPSIGMLAAIAAIGAAAYEGGAAVPATVLWVCTGVMAMERLPLGAAVGTVAVLVPGFVLTDDTELGPLLTTAAVLLAGYSLRLDAAARGTGFRLLAQERAAREAEATSAALAERARIAREIHDVLAHSLSAQLVHLEAARLRIEQEPESTFRNQILERVVAARAMAREGLAETRQALSALRGELAPVEDYLSELAAADGVVAEVTGERRPLSAEASQAVRRVAQEALTNVRKHAPGAVVRMLLAYREGEIALDIRDSGAGAEQGDLTASGSGYGLLGMRERAELLGGSLEAGPDGEGFVVRLRVPA
ncbi:sensor histidine kinase [Streptomyces sp. NBC_00390]|uniref:sensor histidine kinase n=1 Tax=Streptomyces sp. NBC_00390 TaxID=2975736 RepID=UPI002E209E8A